MTFYWWSHWFWITLLCNLFFPLIMVVHTYPSQDFSLEHNQHPPRSEDTKKLVTKLYQASTTRTWLTTESIEILGPNTPSYAEKITLPSVTTSTSEASIKSQTPEYYYYEDEGDDVDDGSLNKSKPIDLEDVEEEEENIDEQRRQQYPSEEEKLNDIKRSAEDFSKASEMETLTSATTTAGTTTASAFVKPKSNYTNFTESLAAGLNSSRSPSSSQANNDRAIIMAAAVSVLATSVNSLSVLPPNNVTVLPHAPSTPQIVKTHRTATDWLRTMDDMVASAAVTSPPLSVSTTDANDDKFPFTLENVHKSEDLRRDENEPRRRQSKGLSAEYKPPGYINYSPESKNLLTRSASTTVNDYDSEENNISSEALSVQRAYFMDVGAISAICFTVFGICCTVGTIGVVLYRRRFLNKPQALSEPDSSVYIDDSTMRVSDNSDEMYSLDNDSFLNSLEAMTIQNYWTDTVKHTKL